MFEKYFPQIAMRSPESSVECATNKSLHNNFYFAYFFHLPICFWFFLRPFNCIQSSQRVIMDDIFHFNFATLWWMNRIESPHGKKKNNKWKDREIRKVKLLYKHPISAIRYLKGLHGIKMSWNFIWSLWKVLQYLYEVRVFSSVFCQYL